MPINKFTTLLDLSRQAKIITGETATFDGKIEVGIPFSGYPTGVDTNTTVSLGIVSIQDAVFSGNSGTTVFDVSNTGSTNYDAIFSGYSATTWSNPLFSGNTSGLTLPITPLSADTQIVGPFWYLTQTGMTGDYVIGTQYTGYSITYSFFNVEGYNTGTTFSGFTTATQENFSAGTLDYKGPLDYISSVEDATVDGRLTTNKLTVTNGASASTIGYVLTQLDETGKAGWVFNSASASTNTFVNSGTLNGTQLDLTYNTGGSVPSIELSGLTFTGNTSGDCINDIFVKNIHSCSPLNINPLDEGDVYFGSSSGITIDLTNERLGIGTSTPTEKLHVEGGDILVSDTNGIVFTDIQNSAGPALRISAGTDTQITRFMISEDGGSGMFLGQRGFSEVSFPSGSSLGKQGDGFLYSGNDQNGLNIISQPGTGTDDYIRFFVGQAAGAAGTPDLYIQGSGSTRGNVGINTDTPTEKLDVSGNTKIDGSSITVGDVVGQSDSLSLSALISQAQSSGLKGSIKYFSHTGATIDNIFNPNVSGSSKMQIGTDIGAMKDIEISYYGSSYVRGGTPTTGVDFWQNKAVIKTAQDTNGLVNANVSTKPTYWENQENCRMILTSDGNLGVGLNPDGTELPTGKFQIGGTGTTGTMLVYGNIGIGNGTPTSKLDISGTTGYEQLRIRNSYTPTTSGDTNGAVGDVAWDDNYIYIKTNSGWGRSSLDYGF